MGSLTALSDSDLLTRMPALVQVERCATADVIEHLVEIDRRQLFLEQACSSLYAFCMERLGYSEDAALRRTRVTRLAERVPQALEELRSGAIHLTGLFLLSKHLTAHNAEVLLPHCRGKSRRKLERLIAAWFPRPDVPPKVQALGKVGLDDVAGSPLPPAGPSGPAEQITLPGTGVTPPRPRVEPLSADRFLIQFTAGAELHEKLEQAQQLLSHAVPSGDLAQLFERALDALLQRERKRRTGAGKPRKRRELDPDARHVPVEVARQVWERDAGQCTFVDAEGRRCSERRFLTFEHRHPFAFGGLPTADNLAVMCNAHNLHAARKVFGEEFLAEKRARRPAPDKPVQSGQPAKPDVFGKVLFALCNLGFRRKDVARVLSGLRQDQQEPEVEPLLRAALNLLTFARK
jgi:hypothetical protein